MYILVYFLATLLSVAIADQSQFADFQSLGI